MSNLVDVAGNAIGEDAELDCEVGTELLGQLVACKVKKDDLVYKLRLYFGPQTVFERRVPYHEFTRANVTEQWKDMLTSAFASFEIGRQNVGMIVDMSKNGIKAQEPKSPDEPSSP